MKKYDGVIFDMDGVLVDSEPIYFDVEKKLFSRLKIQINMDKHTSFVGMPMKKIWEIVKKEFDLSQSIEKLIKIHNKMMHQKILTISDLIPSDGIFDLISANNIIEFLKYSYLLQDQFG